MTTTPRWAQESRPPPLLVGELLRIESAQMKHRNAMMPIAVFGLISLSGAPLLATPNPSAPDEGEGSSRFCIAGYGTRACPRAPSEVGRLSPEKDRLVFVHHATKVAKVLLTPDESAQDPSTARPMGVQFAPGTSSVDDVLGRVEQVAPRRGWAIETDDYVADLPRDASVWSTRESVDWAFELTTGGTTRDEFIYIQGPFADSNTPKADALVGKGMTLASKGRANAAQGTADWIELSYTHEGQPWRQRRYWVSLGEGRTALVTAQTVASNALAVFGAADSVVRSLVLR